MKKNNKVIFITGTPGVGKTTVATNLNKELSKKYISKIFKINEIAIENDLIQGTDSERGYKIVDVDKLNKKLFEIINNENFQNLDNIINLKNFDFKDNKNNSFEDFDFKDNKNNSFEDFDFKDNKNNSFEDLDDKVNKKNNFGDLEYNVKNKDQKISNDLNKLEITIVEGHLSHLCDNCDKVIVLRLDPKSLEKRLEKRGYLLSKIQENLEAESLAVCSVEAFQKHGNIVNEIDTTDMSIDEVVINIKKIIFDENNFPVGKIDFMDWLIK